MQNLQPFRPRLPSKFVKRVLKVSDEKRCKKTHAKKLSMKKWQKKVLDFYYCVQKFTAFNLFGSFLLFLKLIQTQHQMLRLKHPYRIFEDIFLLILALLANFKATIGQNCSRNKKTYFINVSLNHIWHLLPFWDGPFCQKGQNLCTLMYTYRTWLKFFLSCMIWSSIFLPLQYKYLPGIDIFYTLFINN